MADIRSSKIDTVVVYKVDRLTRSLADFAKIVELFDGAGVSFVAVTQQFNTTSSMGRLTLNILLSFAQFEREVTGERIRDKIAASKQKGMWMGGRLSLGYDVEDRKLVINEAEAETVKNIFQRYLDLKSVHLLQVELAQQGVVSKLRPLANGKVVGAVPLCRGAIYRLLANPIYVGLTRHKDACFPGQHHAIIDQLLWDAVQNQLKDNTIDRREHRTKEGVGLLTGKIFDDQGRRLTPTYAKKGSRQYRYYVSQRLVRGQPVEGAANWRVPANQIEKVVVIEVLALLDDQHRLAYLLQEAGVDVGRLQGILQDAALIHAEATGDSTTVPGARKAGASARMSTCRSACEPHHTARLTNLVTRVTIASDNLALVLTVPTFQTYISSNELKCTDGPTAPLVDNIHIPLQTPMQFRRRGQEMRLVVHGNAIRPRGENVPGTPFKAGAFGKMSASDALLKAMARARSWFARLSSGAVLSIENIAESECCNPAYVQRLLPLAFLAPDLVDAIANGRHPVELSLASLSRCTNLPFDWAEQRRALQTCT